MLVTLEKQFCQHNNLTYDPFSRSVGEKYDGRRADVWSCGVILYALLVGALPFDDDNLRQLLEKVKRGVFHVPHFVPPDCQQLLRGMIEVNPEKRMTLAEITRHPWVTAGGRGELEQELPMMEVVQTRVLPSADAIDPDVLQAICSLGCFKQREKLIQELLSPHHNTEKVIYFLLLERKRRRPARDDEPRLSLPPAADPPRKRLDTCRVSVNGQSAHFGQISEGSPITPRRSQFRSSSSRRAEGRSSPQLAASPPTGHTPHRVSSLGGTPNTPGSPLASPSVREHHHQRANSTGPTISLNISGEPGEAVIIINESPIMGSSVSHRPHSPSQSHRIRERSSLPGPTAAGTSPVTPSFLPNLATITGVGAGGVGSMSGPGGGPAAPWRARLATIKNSFLGSPRFHRRKMQASTEEVALTPESSPELTRRSWFGSLLAAGDKDETVTALVKGKPLATVKADLIHAFLSIAELSHSVLSPMSFRVEYKRGSNAPAMFQRHVRFQVDISTITKAPGENGKEYLYAITFTLLSGNIRRFRRVCEVVQAAVCRAPGAARPPAHPPSPRAARRHIRPHAVGEIPDSPETPLDRQASDVDSDCSVLEPRSPNSHTSIDQLENGTHPLGSSSSVTSGSSGYKQSVRRRATVDQASTSLDHEMMRAGRDHDTPGTSPTGTLVTRRRATVEQASTSLDHEMMRAGRDHDTPGTSPTGTLVTSRRATVDQASTSLDHEMMRAGRDHDTPGTSPTGTLVTSRRATVDQASTSLDHEMMRAGRDHDTPGTSPTGTLVTRRRATVDQASTSLDHEMMRAGRDHDTPGTSPTGTLVTRRRATVDQASTSLDHEMMRAGRDHDTPGTSPTGTLVTRRRATVDQASTSLDHEMMRAGRDHDTPGTSPTGTLVTRRRATVEQASTSLDHEMMRAGRDHDTPGTSPTGTLVTRRRATVDQASTSLDHEMMRAGRDHDTPGIHTKRSSSECRETASPRRGLESRDSVKDELRRNNSLRESRRPEPPTTIA
ncbi:hypothetical protein O0L34_g12150 [Tuta absoluta]|nr:hypothetical protein O0L34_g12150 [Tuta absoluta]